MPDVLKINTTNSMIGDVFCLNVTILDDHAVDSDKYFIVSLTPQVSKHFGIMPNSSTSIVTITEDTSDRKHCYMRCSFVSKHHRYWHL